MVALAGAPAGVSGMTPRPVRRSFCHPGFKPYTNVTESARRFSLSVAAEFRSAFQRCTTSKQFGGICCHHLRQSNAAIFRCCWRPVVVVESHRWPGSSLPVPFDSKCAFIFHVHEFRLHNHHRDRQSCSNERTRHTRHSRIHRPTPARVQGRRPIRYIQERHGCHLTSPTFLHVWSIY